MAKKAMASVKRKRRREWLAVAVDAVQQAGEEGLLDDQQARQISRGLRKPRISQQIRAAFTQHLESQQLESAINENGQVDFDSIIDLLMMFFPKLAKLHKFAALWNELKGLRF